VLARVTVTHGEPVARVAADRYVLLNVRASEVSAETFKKIAALRTETIQGAPRLGVGVIFSPIGAKTSDDWQNAISKTLTTDRCRYLCIYNWREIDDNVIALDGIRRVLAEPLSRK
jgi:hypothetical protein